MLRAGIVFLVLALVFAALGYGGLAGDSFQIGKILVFVFLALAVVSIVMNSMRGGSTRDLV